MPAHGRRSRELTLPALVGLSALSLGLSLGLASCGPPKGASTTPKGSEVAPIAGSGIELQQAGGRPRLALVRRDGDPLPAIAIEIRVDGVDGVDGVAGVAGVAAGPRLAALAALSASRLERLGGVALEVRLGARYARIRAFFPSLVTSPTEAARAVDGALTLPIVASDPSLAAIEKALASFAARPVDDPALARSTHCLDRPARPPSFKGVAKDALVATVEGWRKEAVHAEGVVVGVVGASGPIGTFAQSWSALPAFPTAPPKSVASPSPSASILPQGILVTASASTSESAVLVVEGAPRASAEAVVARLVDPDGPLMLRLRGADEWHAKAVGGVAHPEGSCFVVELEPSPRARLTAKEWNADRVTMRAAVALEVARQEIDLALEATSGLTEADAARRSLAQGSDARESADRAAFWGWPSSPPPPKPTSTLTLVAPLPTLLKSIAASSAEVDVLLAPLGPKMQAAVDRARLSWARGEVDVVSRVEAGQGELWLALGSSCGSAHEGVLDAGIGRVAMQALVTAAHPRALLDGVTLEPWGGALGVGAVAHAVPRPSESSSALAHRVADGVARAFLATYPDVDDELAARSTSLVDLGNPPPPGDLVRLALRSLAPEHPSWLDGLGTLEGVARVGPEWIDLRLATLRASPLRIAVLANVDAQQVEVAAHAADRWTPRRPGESRACPVVDAATTPKGAIHPLTVKAGTGVAFAFPVDEAQRPSAMLLAQAIGGAGGKLDGALAASGLVSSLDARYVRGVGHGALVVVALAPDANVEAVVEKLRALFASLRGAGLVYADFARALGKEKDARLLRQIEPRARVVDLFLGELEPAVTSVDLARLRAVAAKVLDEDRAQLVVARTK